jgi:hypothetical protein
MKTMTTITNVETKGESFIATFLGDKKAGTTDAALGAKLLSIFERDPENCLVELELDKRADKLWITGVDYVEAPPELGGPSSPDAEQGADTTAEPGEAQASDSPQEGSAPELRADLPTPIVTLDELLGVEARVTKIEEFLAAKGFTP